MPIYDEFIQFVNAIHTGPLRRSVEVKLLPLYSELQMLEHKAGRSADLGEEGEERGEAAREASEMEGMSGTPTELCRIEERALFDKYKPDRPFRVKLGGQEGLGMTAYVRHLAVLKSNEACPDYLRVFDRVWVIPLKRLAMSSIEVSPPEVSSSSSSSSAIASSVLSEARLLAKAYGFKQSGTAADEAALLALEATWLSHENPIYLIDGYDEIEGDLDSNPGLKRQLIHFLNQPNVIVASKAREIPGFQPTHHVLCVTPDLGARLELIDLIESLCQDPASSVRCAAIELLTRVSNLENHPKLIRLIDQSCRDDFSSSGGKGLFSGLSGGIEVNFPVREAAFRTLSNITDKLPDRELSNLLESLCRSENLAIRGRAFDVFASISNLGTRRELLELLERLCRDPRNDKEGIRGYAFGALARAPNLATSPELLGLLERLCQDENPSVRSKALRALPMIGLRTPPELLALFERLCRNEGPDLRREAFIVMLDKIPDLGACPKLISLAQECCRDEDSRVRKAAYGVLRKVPDLVGARPELISLMEAGCRSEDWDVRESAFWLLKEIPNVAARSDLIPLIQEGCRDLTRSAQLRGYEAWAVTVNHIALGILVEIPDWTARRELVDSFQLGCQSKNRDIREQTFELLGEIPDLATRPQLIEMIKLLCRDETSDVRSKAFRVFQTIVDLSVMEDVIPLIKLGCQDKDGDVRKAAFDVLAHVTNLLARREELIHVINALCEDEEAAVRRGAFETFARLRDRPDITRLIEVGLCDEDKGVRDAVVKLQNPTSASASASASASGKSLFGGSSVGSISDGLFSALTGGGSLFSRGPK